MLTRDDLPPTPEWYVQPHRDVEPAPVDLTLPPSIVLGEN